MRYSELHEADPGHRLRPINVNTPAFHAWFGHSKVVDSQGNPLICFRGTRKVPKPDRFSTKRTIPSFTSSPDVASVYASSYQAFTHTYGSGATVSPVYLSIQNPVDFSRDESVSLADLLDKLNANADNPDDQAALLYLVRQLWQRDENDTMPFKSQLPRGNLGRMDWEDLHTAMRSRMQREADWYDLADYTSVDTYAIVDCSAFVSLAKKHGFDGAIHQDVFDIGARVAPSLLGKETIHGVSTENTHLTYRPFYANQVKSIFNQGSWSKDGTMTESALPRHLRPWLTGRCYDFALALSERLPDAEFVGVGGSEKHPAHVGLHADGRYYDARGETDEEGFRAHHVGPITVVPRDIVELNAGVAGMTPPYRGNRDIAEARRAVRSIYGAK